MGLLLRLFTSPAPAFDAVFDSAVRDVLVPGYLGTAGIVDVLVGRNGETGERVIVSVWEDDRAPDGSANGSSGLGSLEAVDERIPSGDARVLPIAVSIRSAQRDCAPHVIRLFEGSVHEGELSPYIENVREGASLDAAAGGLIALYLAPDGDRGFVTVSAWTDWGAIERATGGDIHQPARTRHTERLESWTVRHFEAVELASSTPRSAVGGTTPAG